MDNSKAMSEQAEQRRQNFVDVYEGRIPKRIPVSIGIDGAAAMEYAGMNLLVDQYSAEKTIETIEYVNREFDTDLLVGFSSRLPQFYELLGAKNYRMGADGYMQHPNIAGIEPEDYDDLIADPVAVCWEKVIPKFYEELAKPAPDNMIALLKMQLSRTAFMAKVGPAMARIGAKYGKISKPFMFGRTRAPFDLMADTFRSFTGMSKDIRRMPEKVLEAVEAVYPLVLKLGMPSIPPSKSVRVGIALHMATFMREKDFAKFWWPSYKRQIEAYVDAGYGVNMFCEDDWMRYLDYLYELPAGCELQFEYGDPKLVKEKIGDKHIIQGLFPSVVMRNGTVEDVERTAKEYMDILAPGGNYVFGFDKSLLRAHDSKPENLKALLKCVQEYGKY